MRKGYGQFCPVAKAAEVLAERWTPLVVRELLEGSTRFNDLHRGVPLMSRSMLSLRLKQLEDAGVVTRNNGTSGLEYHLTDQGKEFAPIVHLLGEWGQRWYRTDFRRDELDVGLLMWDMRRRGTSGMFSIPSHHGPVQLLRRARGQAQLVVRQRHVRSRHVPDRSRI